MKYGTIPAQNGLPEIQTENTSPVSDPVSVKSFPFPSHSVFFRIIRKQSGEKLKWYGTGFFCPVFTLLVTDFVNLNIKSAQSFKDVHRAKMCIHVFIGVSNHMYISIYVCIMFLEKKDKTESSHPLMGLLFFSLLHNRQTAH
jgi:hypothetical protein